MVNKTLEQSIFHQGIKFVNIDDAHSQCMRWRKSCTYNGLAARDARYTGVKKFRGIKSDGITYHELAKYRPQHST